MSVCSSLKRFWYTSSERLTVHSAVEFNVDALSGAGQFNDEVGSMAGPHGVKEHFLALEQEAWFHVHDFKALPFRCIKAECSKVPCPVQDVDADHDWPSILLGGQTLIDTLDGEGHVLGSMFQSFGPPGLESLVPIEFGDGP